MNVITKIGVFIAVALSFFSCNKAKHGLSWNADYSIPLATTTITLNNFIPDSLLENTDGKTGIIYKSTLYELDKSLLFNIPDTTIFYPYNGIPFGSIQVIPGQKITETVQEIQLPTGQAAISRMTIESGKLYYTLTNKITEPLQIIYAIPTAIKNNVSLSVTIEVPGAPSVSEPSIVSGFIDLAGYDVDLTGTLHNSVNKISSTTIIKLSENANTTVLDNSTTFNFAITFNQLKPYYAKGYFGQSVIKVGPSYSNLDVFKNIKSGSINLSKVSCSLAIENGVGVDAKLKIKTLSSSNTQQGVSQNLVHNLINKNLNINRALDNPFQFSNYTIYMDENNSNLKNLIEILPNQLSYQMQVEMNPLGNISNGTDFIYSDRLMKANMLLRIPLNTKLNQLVLQDTIRLDLDDENKNAINYGKLKLYIKNYFNNAVSINLYTINSDYTLGNDISSGNSIAPNLNGSNDKKLVEISLPSNVIADLFATKKILIKVTLDSNGNFAEVNEHSRLEVEAAADFEKTIHLK